jgi:hypothetical protein
VWAVPKVRISLPASLTEQHLRVALKYFENANRLTAQEWKLALDTFDQLAQGTVVLGRRRMTFQTVYDRWIDAKFADPFIARLMASERLGPEGEMLQRESARAILALLEREGLYREGVPKSEYLAAYSLYWWTAFAQGYRYELEVFRDLRASGIQFVTHDPRRRAERRSPYDLVVLRQRGDIKRTTYFLHTARTRQLICDFYIMRLYDSRRRRYESVVFLTEESWRTLDGEVVPAALESAAQALPNPVQVVFQERRFVIVPYENWKARVKQRQQEEG